MGWMFRDEAETDQLMCLNWLLSQHLVSQQLYEANQSFTRNAQLPNTNSTNEDTFKGADMEGTVVNLRQYDTEVVTDATIVMILQRLGFGDAQAAIDYVVQNYGHKQSVLSCLIKYFANMTQIQADDLTSSKKRCPPPTRTSVPYKDDIRSKLNHLETKYADALGLLGGQPVKTKLVKMHEDDVQTISTEAIKEFNLDAHELVESNKTEIQQVKQEQCICTSKHRGQQVTSNTQLGGINLDFPLSVTVNTRQNADQVAQLQEELDRCVKEGKVIASLKESLVKQESRVANDRKMILSLRLQLRRANEENRKARDQELQLVKELGQHINFQESKIARLSSELHTLRPDVIGTKSGALELPQFMSNEQLDSDEVLDNLLPETAARYVKELREKVKGLRIEEEEMNKTLDTLLLTVPSTNSQETLLGAHDSNSVPASAIVLQDT